MRTERLLMAIGTGLALGLLVGCAKPHGETETSRPQAMASTEAPDRAGAQDATEQDLQPSIGDNQLWLALPSQLQLPGLAQVQSAPSWDARIARFSGADQVYLTDINERYFGSLAFHDEEEQRRLIRQGFPMPEEWLAVRDLPDAELERLAKAGNLKAQMFLVDRLSETLAPILGSRGFDTSSPADKELFRRYAEVKNMLDSLVHQSQSPFSAYLYGRFVSATQGYGKGNPPEPIAAAFQFAEDLGDPRADVYRNAFMLQHPGMDAGRVMSSYSTMKATTSSR